MQGVNYQYGLGKRFKAYGVPSKPLKHGVYLYCARRATGHELPKREGWSYRQAAQMVRLIKGVNNG